MFWGLWAQQSTQGRGQRELGAEQEEQGVQSWGHGAASLGIAAAAPNLLQETLIPGAEAGSDSIPVKPSMGGFLAPFYLPFAFGGGSWTFPE